MKTDLTTENWAVDRTPMDGWIYVRDLDDEDKVPVCAILFHGDKGELDAQTLRWAQAIAAVPELLTACKAAIGPLTIGQSKGSMIRAAIAKAQP